MASIKTRRNWIPVAALLLFSHALAADAGFAGGWMLELTTDGPAIVGLLELERQGDGWAAWVEGGPVPVSIDGNDIEVVVDSRDIRGFEFKRRMVGSLTDGKLSGTFTIESVAKVSESDGSWTATKQLPRGPRAAPEPVDITGIWTPAPGWDFRKYRMDLTPAAQEWHDGYLMHYDQPNVRCVSPGITAMVAWGGYPFEVLSSKDRLTFLYEVDSEVRRVFLDGREPPEYFPNSPMGFSTGYWDGSDLVINTILLEPNVRDFRGEPISENARLQEIYSLSEDGQTLTAVVTLHDPENYKRPPVRRRKWTRNPDTAIFPYECDPDSFYRQMYNEDKLDMYFKRSRRRL